MKTKILSLQLIIILMLLSLSCNAQEYAFLNNNEVPSGISDTSGIKNPVTVKVIYDNYSKAKEMKADWGFSIVITGLDKEVLFDTGTKPSIFESNLSHSGIDASGIDLLVLSHEHGDHTGGISSFVKMKTGIPVIFPHSFSDGFRQKMEKYGLKPLLVKDPAMICNHLYTSGEFSFSIPEQALVIDTKKGLAVITGCAHPGIIEMLKEIKTKFNKNIYMVMGGFHLMNKTDREMNDIISGMKALGVVRCGATHCTGDRQIKMFREAFGENYFELGAGNTVVVE
jgi:7,8-dihydropterin-6-yl-methyl-4-(beta-D-ribofuranosyl)aminobenzene 5'-phosphate synthase